MIACPKCGARLQLTLTSLDRDRDDGEGPATNVGLVNASPKPSNFPRPLLRVSMIIGGREFGVSRSDIIEAAKQRMPGRIRKYTVRLEGQDGQSTDFPIKQVVRAVLVGKKTGWDEEGFTAHRARDLLLKLGFKVQARPGMYGR